MGYVDQAALVSRFGDSELMARAPDGQGGIDADTVQRACDDAAGEIDARLSAGGYRKPLSPVPAVVEAYACDIARYRLYDDHAPDVVVARYEHAVRFLRDVARGDVQLAAGAKEPASTENTATIDSTPPVMPGGGF